MDHDMNDEDDDDEFDPLHPNDPSTMELGQTVAIASKDDEKDVLYAVLLEKLVCKESEWTAKIHYLEQNEEGKIGDTIGQPRVESLKHVIMSDVVTDRDGVISNIEKIRKRFNRYFDKVFTN